MLGNFKDFLSVVQDGLSSNNNLRQTLHEVQKVRNLFKDKQKVHLHDFEDVVNLGAGGELLEKYHKEWEELHGNAVKNAEAADAVDFLILALHERTKTQLQSANEMAQSLTLLPSLTASVAQCMDSLKNVQRILMTVEEELVEFEDIVERSSMEKRKLDHHYQLDLYKEKKMEALEATHNHLIQQNSRISFLEQRKRLARLQAEDSSGAEKSRNTPQASPSLPPVTLDQVQLEDDRTQLESFLNS